MQLPHRGSAHCSGKKRALPAPAHLAVALYILANSWVDVHAADRAAQGGRSSSDRPDAPPLDVEVRLRGEGLSHLGEGSGGLECSGGDWSFDWRGEVPGETANTPALLAGNGTFFSSDPRSGWISPPLLKGSGIRCSTNVGGTPQLAFQGSLTPHPDSGVDVQVSMEAEASHIRIGLTDLAVCRVSLSGGQTFELPVSLSANSDQQALPGATVFDRPITFTKEELENGFSKTWQVTASPAAMTASQCMGQDMSGDVTLRYKSSGDDPEIAFDACVHLAKGESRSVNASGSPEGGTYDFTGKPSALFDVLTISSSIGEATVIGEATGRGEFVATYSLGGKSASKSVPASVVQLDAFASGAELEIGMFDVEGKPNPPVMVEFLSQPSAAGDLLVFKPSDPAIVSIAPRQSSIEVQGVKVGTTVIRAETLCGTKLGPELIARVVPCSAETRADLERRKQNVKQRNEAISSEVSGLLNDAEFERVEREIVGDTVNLAIKTGETVVGALALAQGSEISAAESRVAQMQQVDLRWLSRTKASQESIQAVKEVYDLYDTTADLMDGLEAAVLRMDGQVSDADAYEAAVKGVLAGLDKLKNDDRLGLAKSFIEAGLAAQKMGRNLGTLAGVADRLEELDARNDTIRSDWERISRLIRRCDSVPRADDDLELIPIPEDDLELLPIPDDELELIPIPENDARSPRQETRDPADVPVTGQEPTQGGPAEAAPTIQDPSKPPNGRATLPLCVSGNSEPRAIAESIRRAKSAYERFAERMEAAAASTATGPARVLEALQQAAAQGPDEVRAQLPALKAAHNAALIDIATEGDAARTFLGETQRCSAELPLRAIDMRSIEWRFGP